MLAPLPPDREALHSKALKEPDDAPTGTGGYKVHRGPQGIPGAARVARQVPEARVARPNSLPRPSLARRITPRGAAGAFGLWLAIGR